MSVGSTVGFVTRSEVLDNREITPRHFVMRLRAPEIAANAQPGQFIQIRCGDGVQPLLPRPFSVLRSHTSEGAIEILYRVEGIGTRLLSQAPLGALLTIWGPLGHGFSPPYASQHLMVGGGVGIPPLVMLVESQMQSAAWSVTEVKVMVGARTANEVLCATEFQSYGMGISVATDDGSWGHHGVVTQLLQYELDLAASMYGTDNVCVYACGPHGMLKAAAQICIAAKVQCQVCLEAPMPCGFGVCMGCVIPTHSHSGSSFPSGEGGQGVRYRRVCRDGPVFTAREVVWE